MGMRRPSKDSTVGRGMMPCGQGAEAAFAAERVTGERRGRRARGFRSGSTVLGNSFPRFLRKRPAIEGLSPSENPGSLLAARDGLRIWRHFGLFRESRQRVLAQARLQAKPL